MSESISYGISPSYLSHWRGWEAYREVIQNFLDFGDFDFIEDYHGCDGDMVTIHLTNKYSPKDLSFLGIGNSTKRGNTSTRGEHGEGLKMAMMVMLREYGQDCIEIRTNGRRYIPYWDEIPGFGDSFCIGFEKYITTDGEFEVFMEFPTCDYEEFKNLVLKPEDKEFTCSYGSIVDRPPGEIYVGGLYVTKHDKLVHAYDIPPKAVSLGRDRDIPGEFDVRWNASQIHDQYLQAQTAMIAETCINNEAVEDFIQTTTDAMMSGDALYANSIPKALHGMIEPIITPGEGEDSSDRVEFKVGNKQLPERLRSKAFEISKVAEKVQKIKYKIKRRKSIETLLDEFYKKYEVQFIEAPATMIIEFSDIQEKAKKRGV